MTASFAPCRKSTAGHRSAGGGQYFPGFAIALAPFLLLLAGPYDEMPVPIPLLQCSDGFYHGIIFTDFLMLLYGLHFIWICLHLSWIGHRRLSVDLYLFRQALISAIISWWPAFIWASSRSTICSFIYSIFCVVAI
jgi:hypothetical protein